MAIDKDIPMTHQQSLEEVKKRKEEGLERAGTQADKDRRPSEGRIKCR